MRKAKTAAPRKTRFLPVCRYENQPLLLQQGCYDGKISEMQFIDATGLYTLEAATFAELHGNHASLTAEQLVKPVHMIAAVEKAMNSGEIVSM